MRRGFTLVELLIVIAMISLLTSLLLPAVNYSREAARRNGCANNLRQFGIAMHNYESTYGRFPAGYEYRYADSGNMAGYSWGTRLLPYLEATATYDQFDFASAIHAPTNQIAREQHLTVFLCPSDSLSHNGYVPMGNESYAMASYVANFGPPDLDETQEKRDGVFSRNSRTKAAQIIDGLSNTLMVGERENGPFRKAGVHGVHFAFETTWSGAVRDIDDPTDDHGHMVLFQTGHTPNHIDSDDRDVSSPHSSYAQFLLCDGSVDTVSEEIEPSLYHDLGTRASAGGTKP